jgi:hypothetical protein
MPFLLRECEKIHYTEDTEGTQSFTKDRKMHSSAKLCVFFVGLCAIGFLKVAN